MLSDRSWTEIYPPLHLHAILAEGCCARPRILEPFAALSTIPGARCTTEQYRDQWPVDIPAPAEKILIQQRYRSLDLHCQTTLLERGWLLIAELDDEPEAIGVDPMCLRAVHAIQVSTEALAERVREFNPNVMVFPNQIAELPPLRKFEDDGEISIFFGAQNREADWLPIMPTINRVIREHRPDNLVFRVVHDKAFFDALDTGQKTFDPFLPYDQYREILRSCDIALLPLEPTPFNRCKSDIKFLECAAEGVVAIAGPATYDLLCNIDQVACDPKDDRLKNGVYVVGYNNAASFDRQLRSMIEYHDYRREIAENAYYYVSRYRMLGQHFRKRLAWYRELLSSKSDLDRQLLERVPTLAPDGLLRSAQPVHLA